MQKELLELKNLVHALEERMSDSKFEQSDINSMLTEINRIQIRLDALKKQQPVSLQDKKAA